MRMIQDLETRYKIHDGRYNIGHLVTNISQLASKSHPSRIMYLYRYLVASGGIPYWPLVAGPDAGVTRSD